MRVDSNSCGPVAEEGAKTAQWAVFSSAACVVHPRPKKDRRRRDTQAGLGMELATRRGKHCKR